MPRERGSSGPDDRIRIQHMLEAAKDSHAFVAGRSRADLDSDVMLFRALRNALQEIGEAAARVSDEGRNRAAMVPWGQIVAMRNVLVHAYFGVDKERVWKTATEDIPILLTQLELACKDWPLPSP
ncbi:MAG: DUF86 domain-containing protein [Phycisphaerales bacterium]|nr:DUF86 domain-containing protein [Phycisphaerales bacterium]